MARLLAYHSSQNFFDEVSALFYEEIHVLYPFRYPTRELLTSMRAGLRSIDSLRDNDILLEGLISGNTPVTEACSVRTTHVDNGDKLFAGLFYMRPDDYSAVGGDLTISRFKPEYAGKKKLVCFNPRGQVNDDCVEIVDTVQYAKNRLVLLINSLIRYTGSLCASRHGKPGCSSTSSARSLHRCFPCALRKSRGEVLGGWPSDAWKRKPSQEECSQ